MKIKLCLFLMLFMLSACSFKETLSNFKEDAFEALKVNFSKVPLIGKYIKLYPPPSKSYGELKDKIDMLTSYNIPEQYKKEYEEILSKWKEIEENYRKRYYKKAERKIKELKPKIEAFSKKLEAYYEATKKEAQQKYKMIEEKAKKILLEKRGEERLKIELYLWKLRTLLSVKDYEAFFKEIENVPF